MRLSKYITNPTFNGVDVRDYPPLTGLRGCDFYPRTFTHFEVLWKCRDCGEEIKRIIKDRPPKIRKAHTTFDKRSLTELKDLHKYGFNFIEISVFYDVARYIVREAILDLGKYSRKDKQ